MRLLKLDNHQKIPGRLISILINTLNPSKVKVEIRASESKPFSTKECDIRLSAEF
jgi:hypothetical protein